MLTGVYSWRLFFKTFHGSYNNTNFPIEKTHESPLVMLIPLIILSLGAILSGFLFKELLIGNQNENFWKESIFFLEKIELINLPIWLLTITPVLVILVIPLSYFLYIKDKTILKGILYYNKPLYDFLLNKWYFDELYDFLIVNPSKRIGLFFWKSGDEKTIDRYGPDGFSKIINFFQ